MSHPLPRWLVGARLALLAGALGTIVVWLATILGHGPPQAFARAVIALTALTAALNAGAECVRTLSGRGTTSRAAGRWLLGILLLAILACFVGLGHEATGRDYGDEGIYLANAQRINDGWVLRPNFIYPHLLYTLDALALWVAGSFPAATSRLAGLWGVEGPLAVATLVTRWVTAALGALVVLPVFAIGRRVAGEGAGLLGAGLVAVSTLWVSNAHLNLSDVPAAVFATFCLAGVAALLDAESPKLYALAGLMAGLAAGSKYPAGMVAIAIVAVWVRWRLRERSWSWGLAIAGAVAFGTFLLTTPSLLAFPEAIHQGEGSKDLLFGVRQYAARGWTGVVHESNAHYYGGQLTRTFGVAALGLGLVGLPGLDRRERRRLGWLIVFPATWLALLLGLEMAVPRNLLPVLPVLAAALGCGLAGLVRLGRRRLPLRTSALVAGVVVLAFASPAWSTIREVTVLARPTTREIAKRWIEEHLPPGSFLVQEAYTPPVQPPLHSRKPRFVSRLPPEELRHPRYDFVFVASQAYSRFLRPRNLDQPAYPYHAGRYREIFETFPLVREFRPGPWRSGPSLGLYLVDPPIVEHRASVRWSPVDAVHSHPSMKGDETIDFTGPEQWALFKEYLAADSYRVSVRGELPESARVLLRDRSNRILDDRTLGLDGSARVEVSEPAKIFLYLLAAEGSRVSEVAVEAW